MYNDILKDFEDNLDELAYLVSTASLFRNEHPITTLQQVFSNMDDTIALLRGNISKESYLREILEADDIGVDDDPELPKTMWSLLVYLLTLADTYEYDIQELDNIMSDHNGWEYLACNGRHLCYEEPSVAARMINDFISNT